MAIVNLDKIQARKTGNLTPVVFTEVVKNGAVFHLGDLVAGERELHKALKPAASTVDVLPLVLHASVEMGYNPREYALKHFELAVGEEGRGVHLEEGDIFTMTADAFDGAPVVNQFVVPQADKTQLKPAATIGTTRFVGKVIESTILGFDGSPAFAIQVVKN